MSNTPSPKQRALADFAKEVLGDLLPVYREMFSPQKKRILEHFAKTIQAAHKSVPRGWSTTIFFDKITLNVCDHQVLKIHQDMVDVTLSRESGIEGKLDQMGCPSADFPPRKDTIRQPLQYCRCCSMNYKFSLEAIPLIESHYQRVIDVAVKREGKIGEGESPIKSGKSPYAVSHSPGLIDYLRDVLDLSEEELPQPDYCPPTGPSKTLANGRPDSSLDVEPKLGSEQVDGAQGELNSPPDVDDGAPSNGDEPTEALALTKYRIGQTTFRKNLIKLRKCCYVTGIVHTDFLRASHIIPWSESDNDERLDPNNGLLLSPHFDHLFDEAFISFNDDGRILVSPKIPQEIITAFGIDSGFVGTDLGKDTKRYLRIHRERFDTLAKS